MLTEIERINMYGDMTKEEKDLVYRHEGNYKGWICHYTGGGNLIFYKDNIEVYACRDFHIKGWIPECWQECKEKIDLLESK